MQTMQSKIKLSVQTNIKTFTFHVHPGMTVKQAFQLISASALLHKEPSSKHNEAHIPLYIVSPSRNLLLDYLLVQTETTIAEIYSLLGSQTNQSMVSELQSKQLSHSFCQKRKGVENEGEVDVEVIYGRKGKNDAGIWSEHQTYYEIRNEQQSLTDDFRSDVQIQLKNDGSGFVQKRLISKEVISSFKEMQKIMLLREKLIKQATHHVDIFGELSSISTHQKYFVFCFKFIPYLPLKDIISAMDERQRKRLITKVWFFFKYLRLNGFQDFIVNQAKKQHLDLLLDSVIYNVQGQLKLKDISLILHQKISTPLKVSSSEETQIENQIHNFFSKHSTQITIVSASGQYEFDFLDDILDFYDFTKLFKIKTYNFAKFQEKSEEALTMFFNWSNNSPSHSNKKRIFQATTTNKKENRLNDSLQNSKTKKGEGGYLFADKKNKTKSKLHQKKVNCSYLK